jgi:DNA-binding response OmpR family regulator
MKTIVIMDDEFGLADVLSATLVDAGFRVHLASNGAQGLALLGEHGPDLVILDYMMPILDGPAVLRAMHADEGFARIPVLMISSLPESSVRARCSGYLAFLRKPFAFEMVLEAVEKALCPAARSAL